MNEQILTYPEAAKMFKMTYSTFAVKISRSEFAKFRVTTKRMYRRKKYNTPYYKELNGLKVNEEFKELMERIKK